MRIGKVEEIIKEVNDKVEVGNNNIYSNEGEMDTDKDIRENDDSNHKENVTNNEDDTSSEEYRSGINKEEIEKNVSTVEESLESEENDQEVMLERLFTKAIKAEQEAIKCWYNVGKAVRNKVEEERNKLEIKEKSIRTKMYNELTKRLKGFIRKVIQSKIERSERVYKLFKEIGGRSKINRMKNTSMNTIINLKEKKGEVDELMRQVNEIEEEKNIQKIKMEIPIFYGEIGEDPKEWTNQVEKYLSKIGIKDDKRIFEIAKTHLLGNALQWLENEGMCIVNWNKNEIKWLNLKFRIIDKYSSNNRS
uniref:Uncharacterized protein n=1 Tax=Rhizophagus irregularis (strain DAOM 181602 / DAOM 197198 / MUCL 43194) TaxID=747089 RepID=U9TY53_RHIID